MVFLKKALSTGLGGNRCISERSFHHAYQNFTVKFRIIKKKKVKKLKGHVAHLLNYTNPGAVRFSQRLLKRANLFSGPLLYPS